VRRTLLGPDGGFVSSPLPLAPHKAGVVGDAHMRAVLAALDVSAERGGAAGFDRRHDLQLGEADVAGVGLAPRRPMSCRVHGPARLISSLGNSALKKM
jgi:hypothetical protein